jgi:hypothetical protein
MESSSQISPSNCRCGSRSIPGGNSGFEPNLQDDDKVDNDEDTLHSLIAIHMESLLGLSPTDTIFISRDILDAYRSPADQDQTQLVDEGWLGRPKECELCGREMFLTIHHLFPRSEHDHLLRHPPSNLPPDTPFTKRDLLVTHRAWLCRPCHSAVHRTASNRELALEYWNIEKLMGHDGIRKWAAYAAKQRSSTQNRGQHGLRYQS